MPVARHACLPPLKRGRQQKQKASKHLHPVCTNDSQRLQGSPETAAWDGSACKSVFFRRWFPNLLHQQNLWRSFWKEQISLDLTESQSPRSWRDKKGILTRSFKVLRCFNDQGTADLFIYIYIFFLIQLQLSAFSPHPSTPPQPIPPPSSTSTLPLDFVLVSFS